MQAEVAPDRTSTEAVAAVLDRMLEGVAIFDGAGRIVYANAAAASLALAPAVRAPDELQRLADRQVAEVELPGGHVAEAVCVRIDWQGRPARLVTLRDVTQRVRAQASLVGLTEELRSANAHLRQLADVDPLTGLLNRRGLDGVLETEVVPRLGPGRDLVAVMIDCDEFKTVNDTLDHVAGDLVLKAVAERTRAALRPGDALARVGGDEFLVLLPDATPEDALRIANRIRDAAAGSPIVIPHHQCEVALTVSVGVSQIPPHLRKVDDIVARADIRLRQSKLAGKNRVTARRSLRLFSHTRKRG